jgi:FkbM family methyltransferase
VYFGYKLLLDREPDPSGLDHWIDFGRQNKLTPSQFARRLMQSDEYRQVRMRELKSAEFDGLTLFFDPHEYLIGRHLANRVQHEPHITAGLHELLRPGDVFMDIGASMGIHGLRAAQIVGPTGRCIMVEPNPRNLLAIRLGIAANAFSNCQVWPVAAWDKSEPVSLHVDDLIAYTGPADASEEIIMMGMAIDGLVTDSPRVIKMDIDGAEPKAIAGASRLLENAEHLFCEYNPGTLRERGHCEPVEFLQALKQHGFSKFKVLENNKGISGEFDNPSAIQEFFDSQTGIDIFDMLLSR